MPYGPLSDLAYDPFAPPALPAQTSNNSNLAGRQAQASYNTQLDPLTEFAYRNWVAQNRVPTDPNATAPQDYDMRGFYRGLQQGNPIARTAVNPNDKLTHFPDFWKTPLHQSFSSESQWATPSTPSWANDSQLITPGGRVVFDERRQPSLFDILSRL